MHPLLPDLTTLSNDELHKKYGELQKRAVMATRSGSSEVLHQIQLLMDGYLAEISSRNQKMLQELENKNKNFKNIIDIQ